MCTVRKWKRRVAGRHIALAGLSTVLLAVMAATASAQVTDVAANSSAAPTTLLPTARNDRDAEYASLARDVEAFGRELERECHHEEPSVAQPNSALVLARGSADLRT